MIVYKDILKKLKDAGYNTTRIRSEKILSEYTMSSIRNNEPISMSTLDTICKLTGLPVQELIEYKENKNMKTYHMIDKMDAHSADSAREELVHYTFEELKDFFKPDADNYYGEMEAYNEKLESWEKIKNLCDLEDFLIEDYGAGEPIPYEFEEDEIEDEDARQRANRYFRTAR